MLLLLLLLLLLVVVVVVVVVVGREVKKMFQSVREGFCCNLLRMMTTMT